MLAVLGFTASASAAPGIVWDAPASCPDAAEMEQRIERRLGDDIEIPQLEISITRGPAGYVAHIDTRAITVGNQVRTLTSARCDELADAVAVIVARLASEARLERMAVVADPSMVRTTPPRPSKLADESRVEQAAVVTRRKASWGGGFRGLAVSGIGIVPSVGIAGEAAGFVRRNDRFAEVAVARWADRPTFVTAGAPGRVDVGLQTVTLRGGWASARMPLRGWLGVELGSMRGAGVALADPRAGSGRWTAISAGFGVGWPMSRFSRLVGTFEVAGLVERARFALADDTEIYQPALASARCALGLELGWH